MSAATHTFNMAVESLDVLGVAKKEIRWLQRTHVECGVRLGEGKFGCVSDGVFLDLNANGVSYPVAVKELKKNAPEEATIRFASEAALMSQVMSISSCIVCLP